MALLTVRPSAKPPATIKVSIKYRMADRISPVTKASILLYALPPGTSGIIAGMAKMVTGMR